MTTDLLYSLLPVLEVLGLFALWIFGFLAVGFWSLSLLLHRPSLLIVLVGPLGCFAASFWWGLCLGKLGLGLILGALSWGRFGRRSANRKAANRCRSFSASKKYLAHGRKLAW